MGSGVISPPIWVIIIIVTLLITPLITTHEPPSRAAACRVQISEIWGSEFVQTLPHTLNPVCM